MKPTKHTDTPEFPYSVSMFDDGYYGGRARGGFGPEVFWDHPIQMEQLRGKMNTIRNAGDFSTVLFVGCGIGNEVRYFRIHGKDAHGVDVSEVAIARCDASIREHVQKYNGWLLDSFKDKSMDVVASFDVLTLIPQGMLEKLAKEMKRVSSGSIVFRTPVDKHENQGGKYIGNDGVSFRCLTRNQWVGLFSGDGFALTKAMDSFNVPEEMIFIFSRI